MDTADSLIATFQNTGQGWWNESDVAQTIRTPEGSGSLEANIVAFKASHYTRGKDGAPSELAPPLSADADKGDRGRDKGRTFESQEDLAYALCNPGSGGRTHSRQLFTPMMAVRQLTPLECTRLQGFKDDFFDHVLYRGKRPADGPIYKALGNSMAVPVIAWIGKRIAQVDAILSTLESEV